MDRAADRISVIIPAWNAENEISGAVESVLATGYPFLEILLCVDGSKDGTLGEAHRIAREHSEVSVHTHRNGRNRGAACTRNLGLRHATGEFITFLDVDDRFLPNRLEECIPHLRADKELDGVFGKTRVEYLDGADLAKWGGKKSIGFVADEQDEILRRVARGQCWHLDALTLRKRAVQKAGYMKGDLRLGQDVEWFIRLASVCTLKSLVGPEPVAVYRRHGRNRSGPGKAPEQMNRVVKSACDWLKSNGYQEQASRVRGSYIPSLFDRAGLFLEEKQSRKAAGLLLTGALAFPRIAVSRLYFRMLARAVWGGA